MDDNFLKKLEKLIDENAETTISCDDLKTIIKALKENHALRLLIETINFEADNPLYRQLEVGFRHTALTEREVKERFFETCKFIAQSTKCALDSFE